MTIRRHGAPYRIAAAFVSVLLLHASLAKGNDTADKTLSPYFFVKSDTPKLDRLPLKASSADVTVSGVIADVTVEQVYQNEGSRPIEAVYLFPLSTRAAVHAMKMTVGDRVIEAKIKENDDARRTFEQAKKDGKSASLLEQERPNVFQMSVANILPGDRIRVSLSYTELLSPVEGTYAFTFPTVVGPRYNSPREGKSAETWIESPYLHKGEAAPFDFGFAMRIRGPVPIARVRSPSHAVDVRFDDPRTASLSLSGPRAANRDIIIRYRLEGNAVETGLLAYEDGDERYFLMMTAPPKQAARKERVPREHLFIVDVSGSMEGFPLDISKTLMKSILRDLTDRDDFNMLLFAGGNAVFSPHSVPATRGNISRAERWLDETAAGGGTELLPALRRALALPKKKGVSRIVTVLTDGYVSVEKEAYVLVRKRLGGANLFAFGIGTAVNRELIEVLARAGSGDAFVAIDPAEARQVARRYQRYVSSPLLSNIKATFKGFGVCDADPAAIPDLFAERPIVVHGKYKGDLKGEIVITGTRGDKPYREVVPVSRTAADHRSRSLALLFARSRIRTLSDEAYLDGGTAAKQEITRLGLEYGLMTPYTSFVAVDEVRRNPGGASDKVKQPSPLPAGVFDAAVGVDEAMALGALVGSTVKDQYGFGGLGLAGNGSGGGGGGSGIGLGSMGTIGRGGGGGSGMGYGRGGGGLGARRAQQVPKIRSGAAMVKGNLSKEVIRRIVHRHLNELKACYNALLAKNPGLGGKIVVRFTITPSGAVAAVTVTESTMNDEGMEACLVTAIEKWQFPSVDGGGIVVVTYPFLFEIAK